MYPGTGSLDLAAPHGFTPVCCPRDKIRIGQPFRQCPQVSQGSMSPTHLTLQTLQPYELPGTRRRRRDERKRSRMASYRDKQFPAFRTKIGFSHGETFNYEFCNLKLRLKV
jgi:hypothetical protein